MTEQREVLKELRVPRVLKVRVLTVLTVLKVPVLMVRHSRTVLLAAVPIVSTVSTWHREHL